MKEYLTELVRAGPTPAQARNVAREYLQARILAALQRAGAMIPLALHGGTSLRLLYGIDRYSEDLDFALEGARSAYDFRAFLRAVRRNLRLEGYAVELRVQERRVVHAAFVRFGGLLHELGLSPNRSETLSVKIEIDTNPPSGAGLATSIVRRYVMLQLQHHDQASLLAGKLHAILNRPYTKGRDLYDLLWYLSDPTWPEPNLILLENALRQTSWSGAFPSERTWREIVGNRLRSIAWDQVVSDVQPFLEPNTHHGILTRENVLRVLRQGP